MPKPLTNILALAAGVLLWTAAAEAKPARCFTSDDGKYPCDFRATDKAGSFAVSAPGKPTYMLEMDGPGVAFGFADFGTGRNVALPGQFERDSADPACWNNTDTDTKICAW